MFDQSDDIVMFQLRDHFKDDIDLATKKSKISEAVTRIHDKMAKANLELVRLHKEAQAKEINMDLMLKAFERCPDGAKKQLSVYSLVELQKALKELLK